MPPMETLGRVLGIDIGGTKIALAIASIDGTILAETRFPTEAERGPYFALDSIHRQTRQLLEEAGGRLIGIGIGCGGPLDPEAGLILSPPNLPGWDRFPLVALLEDAFSAPAWLDNDANIAALGEYRHGAGRGFHDMVYATVSTGIGGGIIIGGHLVHGVGSAGEIGHQTLVVDGPRCGCGNAGCLEALASGTAIGNMARERLRVRGGGRLAETAGGIDNVTAKEVATAVREGDPLAIDVWNEAITYLAIGFGNVITILAPQAVVVGGGVAQAADILFDPLRRLIRERVRLVPVEEIAIVPADLGQGSGIVGAIALALDRITRNPETSTKAE